METVKHDYELHIAEVVEGQYVFWLQDGDDKSPPVWCQATDRDSAQQEALVYAKAAFQLTFGPNYVGLNILEDTDGEGREQEGSAGGVHGGDTETP